MSSFLFVSNSELGFRPRFFFIDCLHSLSSLFDGIVFLWTWTEVDSSEAFLLILFSSSNSEESDDDKDIRARRFLGTVYKSQLCYIHLRSIQCDFGHKKYKSLYIDQKHILSCRTRWVVSMVIKNFSLQSRSRKMI